MRFSMLVVKNLARQRAWAKEVVLGSEAASKLGAEVGENGYRADLPTSHLRLDLVERE
jgi:hypothetical protein